jgi:hypothetical protein
MRAWCFIKRASCFFSALKKIEGGLLPRPPQGRMVQWAACIIIMGRTNMVLLWTINEANPNILPASQATLVFWEVIVLVEPRGIDLI